MKWIAGFILGLFLACGSARALAPDELLLIVNKNEPQSQELADFYTKARLVPDGRILSLDLPKTDACSFQVYEQQVVPAVRKFLRDKDLEQKVKCLVTFYGVPLRVDGKPSSSGDKAEVEQLKKELDEVTKQIKPVVEAAEDLLKKYTADYTAEPGESLEVLSKRADAVIAQLAQKTFGGAPPPADAPPDGSARTYRAINLLAGSAMLTKQFSDEQARKFGLSDVELQSLPAKRKAVEDGVKEYNELVERRFESDARARLRAVSRDLFGLFGVARLIVNQSEYLQTDGTVSAFDNELALLWVDWYSHEKWVPNYLNYRMLGNPAVRRGPRVLMTARIDAPTMDIARTNLILNALKAEKDGLKGKVVVDRRGLAANSIDKNTDKPDGYGPFDQTLAALANLMRERVSLPLVLDDREPVIPANAGIDDVAIYCGWYSVKHYVPSFKFNAGAVGYHIASFELESMHAPNFPGWVPNLIKNGCAASLGPVAEPYLHSFPAPDEFFPLLLTGKLTLAETYWRTNPLASWMQVLVGDPLYNPFKANPQMTTEELPDRLRISVSPAATFQ